MKCKICNQFFLMETSFQTLFHFEDICSLCENVYSPILQVEVIPFQGGLIHYYYLYVDLTIDFSKELYLMKYLVKPLNVAISHKNDFDIILFLDLDDYQNLPNWFTYFSSYKNIMFYSLGIFDLSKYVRIF
ncbi:MAG: hypothetical protein KJ971_02065 [Firmicutes bacterium]|nr:hypothetical protein [Bacillota bacterium]